MCPKNPSKRSVNRHFQAKLPKSTKCNISEIIHPISPKFGDKTHHQWHIVGGPPQPFMKYNVADVRYLEN